MTDNLFGPLCILIYLFVLDWRMALLSLVSIPVGMLFMMLVMIGYGEKYAGSVRTAQEMNFMDSLAKIGTIVGTVDEILNQKRHADGRFRQKGFQERKHKGQLNPPLVTSRHIQDSLHQCDHASTSSTDTFQSAAPYAACQRV